MMDAPLPCGYCGISCALCNRHLVDGPSACALCPAYPCNQVRKIGDFSDLNTDRHFEKNCRRIAAEGFDGWYAAYRERAALLERALARYNNGRMKRYLCELFLREDLETLRALMARAEGLHGTIKERSAGFRRLAEELGK